MLSFFNKVEEAYESKVEAKEYMEAYRAFKKVVPSIGEESVLDGSSKKWAVILSIVRPRLQSKKRKDGFLLKNKLEFAKQIVLEAGDTCVFISMMTWWSQKRLGRQI